MASNPLLLRAHNILVYYYTSFTQVQTVSRGLDRGERMKNNNNNFAFEPRLPPFEIRGLQQTRAARTQLTLLKHQHRCRISGYSIVNVFDVIVFLIRQIRSARDVR